MNKDKYFIKAPCHQSSKLQGVQFAPDELKTVYDFDVGLDNFNGTQIDQEGNIMNICPGYQMLHDHIISQQIDF